MGKKPEIEKIYPLAPMQEGMLFHWLMDRENHAYFEQTVLTLQGVLDVKVLEESFNKIIERYDVFRTIFVYEKVQKPRQVVLKERHASIYFEDITDFAEEEKELCIQEFKTKDRKKGFDLKKDLLLRIAVFKLNQDSYKLIWSFHHIIMDGWCMTIISKELFEIYSALSENKTIVLEKVEPYSNYITWLEEQDRTKAKEYWEGYLKDYKQLAGLPKHEAANTGEYIKEDLFLTIEGSMALSLAGIAAQSQVSLNTLFQAIWGILLQKYNHTDDVVFGAVVSGRPSEIEGIDRIVGIVMNTIPVRVRCRDEGFSEVVKQLQQQVTDSQYYTYYPLYEIQADTPLKKNLFDHLIAFENYPLEAEVKNLIDGYDFFGFHVSNIEVFEHSNYDLNVVVIPGGGKLVIKLIYNTLKYDGEALGRLKDNIGQIVDAIIRNPDIPVSDIDIVSAEERVKLLRELNGTGYGEDHSQRHEMQIDAEFNF